MSAPKGTTYINCPYEEKDAAKILGARWDSVAKKWYVLESAAPLFARWLPKTPDGSKTATTPTTPVKSATTQEVAKTPKKRQRPTDFEAMCEPRRLDFTGECNDFVYESLRSWTEDYIEANKSIKGYCWEFVNNGSCLMQEAGLPCRFRHSLPPSHKGRHGPSDW